MAKILVFLFLLYGGVMGKYLTVNIYSSTHYWGSWSYCDLEVYETCGLESWATRIMSTRIVKGSCARLTHLDTHLDHVIGYPTYDLPTLGNYSQKVRYIWVCGRPTRTSDCPSGSFIKKFATKYDNNRLSHFAGHCYKPGNRTHPSSILQSHTSLPSLDNPLECIGAIRGVSYNYDSVRETYYNIRPSCSPSGTTTCGRNEALCGFSTTTEQYTNLIKAIQIKCCDVGDPAQICDPTDFFQPILICDGLGALAPTTCIYSVTTGLGNSTSSESSAGIEKSFYQEMGYSIGFAGDILQSSFNEKLGESGSTSFNWRTASSSTWSQEITTTVELTIPACVKAELFQVVGSCSFFSVRVAHYKRVDTSCNGTVTETLLSEKEFASLMKVSN